MVTGILQNIYVYILPVKKKSQDLDLNKYNDI